MQLDLALFLRLSRTIEGRQATPAEVNEEHSALLKSLDLFLMTVQERSELLRGRETVQQEQPVIQVEAIVEEVEEAPAAEEAPPVPWTGRHDLLYEDVLWLFKVGDNEGALVSLGRLLNVAYDTQELSRFLDINRPKLVGLYEKTLGSFDRELEITNHGLGDRYFWNVEEAQATLNLARQEGSIGNLLAATDMPDLRALALLHRMYVERVISFQDEADQAVN